MAHYIYNDEQAASFYPKCNKLLTREEEVDLFKLLEAGTEVQKNRAKETIVNHNCGLVFSVANKYHCEGMPKQDLVQEGMIGLMQGIEKYDYRRGFKFATYAVWWITQGITRAINDKAALIRIPVHNCELLAKAKKLPCYLGEDSDAKNMAEQLGASEKTIKNILSVSRAVLPLDAAIHRGEEEGRTLEEMLEDKAAVTASEELNRELLAENIQKILLTIPARYREVLELRFGLVNGAPCTLDFVSEYYGITKERVRQIEMNALKLLRHPSRLKHLRGCVNGLSQIDRQEADINDTHEKYLRRVISIEERFKTARVLRGSHRSVASRLGVCHVTIGRIERGEKPITDRWFKALLALPKLTATKMRKRFMQPACFPACQPT